MLISAELSLHRFKVWPADLKSVPWLEKKYVNEISKNNFKRYFDVNILISIISVLDCWG